MSVVQFRETERTSIRKAKEQARQSEYVEYRKWRDLIQTEIMAFTNKGGTYKTISARTGLCVATISKLASKETVMPRMDTMYRVLTFLGYRLFVTKD
jgi:transcriptional regulator with XRE-family HTH domain